MIKYTSLWIILTSTIGITLFGIISLISRTSFSNIFSEFEILLMLIGFASVISTIIISTKLIINGLKINN